MPRHAPDAVSLSPIRSGWAVGLGVVLALVFGGTVWAAIARDDPAPAQLIIVHPSASLPGPPPVAEHGLGTGPSASASPSPTGPSPSATPSLTPSVPTASPTPPTSPAASAPAARPSPTPPSAVEVTARYVLSSTWDQGFVANVDVVNSSARSQTFDVRLTFPDTVAITVTGFWNATPSTAGNTLVFTGGPLAPGGTVRFGFQAEKNRSSQVNPTGCTVNGRPCVGV